jgi:hypothetical protein
MAVHHSDPGAASWDVRDPSARGGPHSKPAH